MGQRETKPILIDTTLPFNMDNVNNLIKREKMTQAIKLCMAYADKKEPAAYHMLGKIFAGRYYGYNTIKRSYFNYDLAIKYFNMAIEHYDVDSDKYLALLYYYGSNAYYKEFFNETCYAENIKPNYIKSYKLFNDTIRVNDKDSDSYIYIGKHHEYGYGVAIDYKLAMDNYIKAYELEHKPAIIYICDLFMNEKGVEMKSDDSIKWMYKCLSYDNVLSKKTKVLFNIAKIYAARNNYAMALEYCSKADLHIKTYTHPWDLSVSKDDREKNKLIHEISLKQELYRTSLQKDAFDKIQLMGKIMNEQKKQIDTLLSIAKTNTSLSIVKHEPKDLISIAEHESKDSMSIKELIESKDDEKREPQKI